MCGERHHKTEEKPMVFQMNERWSQKNDAQLQQLELRRGN